MVISIMAILAGVMIPRLTGIAGRRFDLFSTQVADAMLLFAQRDLSGGTPIGIDIVPGRAGDRPRLRLLTLSPPRGFPDAEPEWQPDAFLRPVPIPMEVDAASLRVIVDGEELDITTSPFRHVPGDRRPTIEVTYTAIDGRRSALVSLPPYAVSPTIQRNDGLRIGQSPVRAPIDLDASGQSREDW